MTVEIRSGARKPLLVTYGDLDGLTLEVAQEITRDLERRGRSVVVLPFGRVERLAGYEALVLGAPLRGRHWLRSAPEFLRIHRAELEGLPMAWFTTWFPAGRIVTRHQALCCLDEVLEDLHPIAPQRIGVFRVAPGARDLPVLSRLFTRQRRRGRDEGPDREEIRRWVDTLDIREPSTRGRSIVEQAPTRVPGGPGAPS